MIEVIPFLFIFTAINAFLVYVLYKISKAIQSTQNSIAPKPKNVDGHPRILRPFGKTNDKKKPKINDDSQAWKLENDVQ